jgi:hypothetical protein
LPVIFIKEQEVASTCRGTYSATSRFCIKKVLPAQHHCGISSHKNKKYPVKGDTYWAPGGYVRGALVAMCGECVEATKIPPSMMELFGDSELRTSTEWCNIIIDASMPTPSLPSYRDPEEENEVSEEDSSDDEKVGGNESIGEISALGTERFNMGTKKDAPGWRDIGDKAGEEWVPHIVEQRAAFEAGAETTAVLMENLEGVRD